MSRKKKFFFKLYYIGKEKYYGSQRQDDVLTVEDKLIEILKKRGYISDEIQSEFQFASRTDRYVSARGGVFSVIPNKEPICMEINSYLPKDIGIWALAHAPINYSPRFNAISRHYRYIVPKSLSYLRKHHNFNLDLFKKACSQLEGTHDFQNFSKREISIKNTTRTLDEVNLEIINDTLIIDFISEAFLRQQIRRMIKKLLEVGMGEIKFEDFLNLFDSSNFISYESANPIGLILWDIHYDSNVDFREDKKSVERMNTYFLEQKHQNWLKYKLFSCLKENDFC